jgi:hypothetical protein
VQSPSTSFAIRSKRACASKIPAASIAVFDNIEIARVRAGTSSRVSRAIAWQTTMVMARSCKVGAPRAHATLCVCGDMGDDARTDGGT